ncbi:eliciting plant response like protein [Conoideocrella luteorostrata]|uniref:Eliciting plant response like protein n=1 Tax=Conoideocrella luteorostrata TaxID=1105319 RepID=A0AAJ0FUP4_9HYPO|nr:eliciting plant response like protein [Conoideocrella luteorostrata]
MQLSRVSNVLPLAAVAAASAASTAAGPDGWTDGQLSSTFSVNVTFDKKYDDPERELSKAACWREGQGLIPGWAPDWRKQKDVPARILAIDKISNSRSTECISCWMLQYGDTARPFLAIDHADAGYVLSREGMDSLTGGKAEKLGTVTANATQMTLGNCGFSYTGREEL